MINKRKYDYLISLGLNCETRFQIKQKFGAIESSLLEWAVVRPEHLVKVFENPHIIFSGEIKELPAYNMWHCNITNITFHGQHTVQELLDGNGNQDIEKVQAEKQDTISRVKYLCDKFVKINQSKETKLYILGIHPDFCKYSENELKDYIQKFSAIIQKNAINASLLVILADNFASTQIKNLDNNQNLFIRFIDHFSPFDKATTSETGDSVRWKEIFSEFSLKTIKDDKKIYKFEK